MKNTTQTTDATETRNPGARSETMKTAKAKLTAARLPRTMLTCCYRLSDGSCAHRGVESATCYSGCGAKPTAAPSIDTGRPFFTRT